MLMRLGLCSRRIAILENSDLIVLEDDFVLVRIGVRRITVTYGAFPFIEC